MKASLFLFLRRGLAYLIDVLLMFAGFVLTQWIIFVPMRMALGIPEEAFQDGWFTEGYTLLTASLPIWMYFSWMERSRWQATVGKRWLGLQTVDAVTGDRVRFGQSFFRTLIKLLPWELAHLTNNLPTPIWYEPNPGFRAGFALVPILITVYALLALFTKKNQSLHDLITKTIVISTT
jgi:uncharacterized RDD family membrane protein YckC